MERLDISKMKPHEYLSADHFQVEKDIFLATVDRATSYLCVYQVKDHSSSEVIRCIEENVRSVGLFPAHFMSDNAAVFTSEEIKSWAKENNIKLQTSAQYCPQSNGLGEKGVDLAKKIILKSREKGEKWQVGVRAKNNSTRTGNVMSPAQMMHGQPLRDNLPRIEVNVSKKEIQEAKDQKEKNAKKVRESKNGVTHKKDRFKPGERVMLQEKQGTKKYWVHSATILGKHEGDDFGRSYRILKDNGEVTRRNVKDIKSFKQKKEEDEIQPATADNNDVAPSAGPHAESQQGKKEKPLERRSERIKRKKLRAELEEQLLKAIEDACM